MNDLPMKSIAATRPDSDRLFAVWRVLAIVGLFVVCEFPAAFAFAQGDSSPDDETPQTAIEATPPAPDDDPEDADRAGSEDRTETTSSSTRSRAFEGALEGPLEEERQRAAGVPDDRVPAEDGESREIPDYDGREPESRPVEGLLWIPRIVFLPVYAVTEYLLRRPIGAVVKWVEKNKVPQKVANALQFDSNGKVGLYPTALADFGLRSSVGLYFFANDLPTRNDFFRIHAAYGGPRWWRLTIRERIALNGEGGERNYQYNATRLNFNFIFDQRPDHLFYGIGAIPGGARASIYEERRISGHADIEVELGQLDGFLFGLTAGQARFRDGDDDLERADELISERFSDDPARFLPGFEGFAFAETNFGLTLDTRPENPALPGTGFAIELEGMLGASIDQADYRYAQYEVSGAAYWDVDGRGRVLSLRQHVGFADPIADGLIPFNRLSQFEKTTFMRGFYEDRFRGRSTFSTLAQYTYPVWAFVDGYVWYSVGNSFDAHLDGFTAGELASTYGLGLRSNGDRDGGFTLMVGFGMEPFENSGYHLDEVRFVFGFQQGI